jgi:hypothetical protein
MAALVSALALAPLGVLAPPMVADVKASEGGTVATITDTNLRKAPGTDSEILALIPKGAKVEIANCHDGWCRVSWKGDDGYVVRRNLAAAAALQWPVAPIAAWSAYDRVPLRKAGKLSDAREEGGAEHSWVLEYGAAGEWPLNGERPNFGGTIAAEIEPIENWLELEFGFSTLGTTGHTELSGDVLFKKPFRLSPTVEFMIGGGPSLSRTLNGPDRGNSWTAEFALDWMFWPTKNVGWFFEPTWSLNPKNGQQSIAVNIGLLIGFPK